MTPAERFAQKFGADLMRKYRIAFADPFGRAASPSPQQRGAVTREQLKRLEAAAIQRHRAAADEHKEIQAMFARLGR